jgi:hypothetical protein
MAVRRETRKTVGEKGLILILQTTNCRNYPCRTRLDILTFNLGKVWTNGKIPQSPQEHSQQKTLHSRDSGNCLLQGVANGKSA